MSDISPSVTNMLLKRYKINNLHETVSFAHQVDCYGAMAWLSKTLWSLILIIGLIESASSLAAVKVRKNLSRPVSIILVGNVFVAIHIT